MVLEDLKIPPGDTQLTKWAIQTSGSAVRAIFGAICNNAQGSPG